MLLSFILARRLRCRRRIYYPHHHKCCFGRYLRLRHQPCRHNQGFVRVGCFRDRARRALRIHLGNFPRHIAVRTCARLAWSKGYKLFSVQNGGQCFSGPLAYRTYYRYGGARNCRGGLGGAWANDVYFFNGEQYRSMS